MAWWLQNNLRMIQNNLRDIDAAMDVEKWFEEIRASHCSCVMVGAGGITSFYPTELPYQTKSPYLRDDCLGKIVDICHKNGVRVIARFDFSKTHERILSEHPEWFYVSEDGAHLHYNDTAATCVLGEYQQEKSVEIIREVLTRYPVDGIFFNMFGFQTKDYSNVEHGICNCEACKKAYRAFSGKELPKGQAYRNDPDYATFKEKTVGDLLLKIRRAVKEINPEVAICTYHHMGVDIIRDESNSAVDRPLPFFLYSASENCQAAAYSWAGEKTMANVAINAVDIFYRFQGVSPALTKLRLYENIAAGSQLDYCIIGDFAGYPDRAGVEAMREVFRFHEEHEKLYGQQRSEAKVLLFRTSKHSHEYLGLFKMLKEKHIQFDVLDSAAYEIHPEKILNHDIVLLPGLSGVPEGLITYVKTHGGKVLITGFTGKEAALSDNFPQKKVFLEALSVLNADYIRTIENTRAAYLNVSDKTLFSSFPDRNWVITDRAFGVCSSEQAALPLVHAAMFGPPERCFGHEEETERGLLFSEDRTAAAFTMDIGSLFYDYGYADHRDIFADVLCMLSPESEILTTNAPSCVEIFLHRLPDGRQLLQLLNLSGFNGMTVEEPHEIHGVSVTVGGRQVDFEPLGLYQYKVLD